MANRHFMTGAADFLSMVPSHPASAQEHRQSWLPPIAAKLGYNDFSGVSRRPQIHHGKIFDAMRIRSPPGAWSGIPPLAGFWSKDLRNGFCSGAAFYMLTFEGAAPTVNSPRETGRSNPMTVPEPIGLWDTTVLPVCSTPQRPLSSRNSCPRRVGMPMPKVDLGTAIASPTRGFFIEAGASACIDLDPAASFRSCLAGKTVSWANTPSPRNTL